MYFPKSSFLADMEHNAQPHLDWYLNIYVYAFTSWDRRPDIEERICQSTTLVKPSIEPESQTRAIQIDLRPTWGDERDETERPPKAIIMPSNQAFEMQLQGDIKRLGQYDVQLGKDGNARNTWSWGQYPALCMPDIVTNRKLSVPRNSRRTRGEPARLPLEYPT